MKALIFLIFLCSFLGQTSPLLAQEEPAHALSLDQARIEEITQLVKPLDKMLRGLITYQLDKVAIHHRLPVRGTELGPVPRRPGFDGRITYAPDIHIVGSAGGSMGPEGEEIRMSYTFLVENPVVESITPKGLGGIFDFGIGCSSRPVEKTIRLTYDFVVLIDADTSDETVQKIVLPVDVTILATSTHGPRESGSVGWNDEHRLMESTVGAPEMIETQAE